MKILLILPIRFYQVAISPLMAPHCRFYPSCSAYAVEALQRFGAVRGGYLALNRILRCHPWADGGLDPVPTEFSLRAPLRADCSPRAARAGCSSRATRAD